MVSVKERYTIMNIRNTYEKIEYKENVKATFFIVGQWAEKFPDKVSMIAKQVM